MSMENPFEETLTSTITIIKPCGDVLGPLKASVQSREILFFEVQYAVSTGDKIVRDLPSGLKETYEVENAEYQEGFFDIPPCYRLHVRKEDDRTRDKTLSATNIFNVKGDFSRVNVHSLDNSLNIQDRSETVFDAARQKLHAGIEDQGLLKELLTHLQVMEDAKSQSKWAAAYSKFIEGLANHMTIIAPLLPALAETVSHLTI
jgi:hypothetical protein